MRYPDVFAGVLVGGFGRRLGGVDKARLSVAQGEGHRTSILHHLVSTLQPHVSEVVLAGREGQSYPEVGCRMVVDHRVDAGPLAGLESLLLQAPHPWCFLLACDLPRFDIGLLDALVRARTSGDQAVVLQSSRGFEPTCALYHVSVLTHVQTALERGVRALHRVIEQVDCNVVATAPELERALFNVNEAAELQALRL